MPLESKNAVNTVDAPIAWLLDADEPWIAYRVRVDLLEQPEHDPEVQALRQAMQQDARIASLLAELANWPGVVLASHKSASQPFHKLTFIADLGLRADDPMMAGIIAKIMGHQSPEGPFQLPMSMPVQFGGSGREVWAWALCDAPLVLYALIQFGLEHDPALQSAAEHLHGLVRANGWPCTGSKELGKFRGPGRKEDPCPFATLAMLKALSVSARWRDSEACYIGAEALLSLWRDSRERHPYMFYMGTDFRKLKVPFVWYDLMHVLDVLSRFPWLAQDARLLDMLAVADGKADPLGRFTPESVWTAWKGWEFGQKREPSRWLTFLIVRILKRLGRLSL